MPQSPSASLSKVPQVTLAFLSPAAASTVSQRLEQLDTLHATGAITDAEYNAKRQEILADL